MSDLDGEIVALRVSGESEPEICVQLGCTLARMLAPENVLRILVESFETWA
jgi:hypothetical protein